MRRKIIVLILSVALLCLAGAVLRSRAFGIDTLRAPISVKSWSVDGLLLTDGRTLLLPGLRTLPSRSAALALAEVTKRGVEIGDDGRVYGLVRVHHWCGTYGPVREHIARVDISDMMTFLQTVDSALETESGERNLDREFSQWGWRVGQFLEFQSWQRSKTAAHEPGA